MLKRTVSLAFTLLFLNACFSPEAKIPLRNTYWSLTELNGESIHNEKNQPEAYLLFHINDNTLHGSDGCNQIQAEYTRNKDLFRFESIRLTQHICKEGVAQSEAFLQALRKADEIQIIDDELILYQKHQEIVRLSSREAL